MAKSGEIIFIKELYAQHSVLNDEFSGKYVRLTGELVFYEPNHKIGILSHQSFTIVVNLTLLNINLSYVNTIIQIIGEIKFVLNKFQVTQY